MGNVVSLFGSEEKALTSDNIVQATQSIADGLSERDSELLAYAKRIITDEAARLNLMNITVRIDFQDRRPLSVTAGNGREQLLTIMRDNLNRLDWRFETQYIVRSVIRKVQNVFYTKDFICR